MDSSEPDTVKVIEELSASVAVTVPIPVWFSAALNEADDVNTGKASLTSVTVTVMFCVVELVPSVAVTVAVYEDFVS